MYPVKTPSIVKGLFPGLTWNGSRNEKSIFLTFDDGPTPEVTSFVLDELKKVDAVATFFLVGKNAVEHPDLVDRIKREGHAIGNHTYSHYSGWKCNDDEYFSDVEKCAEVLSTDLFRPPYGRIKLSQARELSKRYRIVMWDVLSGDFDERIDADRCAKNVLRNTTNGSIIVFHDSLKAAPRMQKALPEVLDELIGEGYAFRTL